MLNSETILKVFTTAVLLNLDELGGAPEAGEFDTIEEGVEYKLPDLLEESFGQYGIEGYKQPDGFEVKLEEQFGGEGQGDDYWLVFSVTDKATSEVVYAKFTGWYASHHGHEFENGSEFKLVEPVQVSVRQWKNK